MRLSLIAHYIHTCIFNVFDLEGKNDICIQFACSCVRLESRIVRPYYVIWRVSTCMAVDLERSAIARTRRACTRIRRRHESC